jgi:hypothetical protein
MVQLGLALDNFHGLGQWRDTTGAGRDPIHSSVFFPTAPSSTGLRVWLKSW